METLLTGDQVAEILTVTPRSVARFVREGKLPGVRLGNRFRFRESDVERFIAERLENEEAETRVAA